MAKKANLWELDRLAQRYGQRPSSFLGLEPGDWAAYQLDVATMALGAWVDGKLRETDRQGRPIHKLTALLDDSTPGDAVEFRGMGQLGQVRTMRVPETGVW